MVEERVNYKVKSALTIGAIVIIMLTVGLLVNKFQGGITGAITTAAACSANSDCNDGITCTIDSCKNPGVETAFCVNTPVDFCKDDDGCCPIGCAGSDNDC